MDRPDTVKDFSENVLRVADGIVEAEGWIIPGDSANYPNGTRSYIYHNPGNLFGSIYEKRRHNGYSYFENDFVGFYALCHQIRRYFDGHLPGITDTSSLKDMLKMYTGLVDGVDLTNYLLTVYNVSGFDQTTTIGQLK